MSAKAQKEQFVSGLLGGSPEEVYHVTSVALTAYLSYTLLQRAEMAPMAVDFACNALSLLLSITLYALDPSRLHLLVLVPGLVALFMGKKLPKTPPQKTPDILPRKSFITAYRTHMVVITNFAILAVDFRLFPRRFAKVETWGTSLMDMGVGLFVFSMGLANLRLVIKQRLAKTETFSFRLYWGLIRRSFVKAAPVLLLGVIRLVSVKTLEYQEHVTEYGIHWNFFVTLGLLPVFLAVLDPVLNAVPRFAVAFIIGLAYQLVLNSGLAAFVLRSDNRMDSLVTMNKEGIASFAGYLSIFIFGQAFGLFVLTGYETPRNLISVPSENKRTKKGLLTVSTTQGLVVATLFAHLVFWVVQQLASIGAVSRRLANLSYVLWVVSYNASFLLGYNIIERIVGESTSPVLESINRNGLAIFLLANLGTGLVNMTINTLETNTAASFAILAVYGMGFVGAAVALDKLGLYIKL